MGVSGLFPLLLTCLLFFPLPPLLVVPLPDSLRISNWLCYSRYFLSLCLFVSISLPPRLMQWLWTMKAWPRYHWSLSYLCLVGIMKLFTKDCLIPTFHFLIVCLCWVWLFDKDVCQKSHLVLHVPVSNLTAHSAYSHTNTCCWLFQDCGHPCSAMDPSSCLTPISPQHFMQLFQY